MSDYREQVIDLGDDASSMLYEACKLTWPNRKGRYGEVIASVDHYRGMRMWSDAPLLEVPEPEKLVNSQEVDGIGTKVRVTQMTSKYGTAAHDMLAMAIDDAAIRGFEPAVVTTALAVNQLGDHNEYMEQLAKGAVEGCRVGRVAMFGGETAVVGDVIGGFGDPTKRLHFDWTATAHSKGHIDRLIDNTEVEPGMVLVALQEHGFRSNGFTGIQREIAPKHFGSSWYDRKVNFSNGDQTLGEAVLRGSIIYTPVYVDAIGGFDTRNLQRVKIAGAAHITGGGVKGKLGDMLAVNGLGAEIDDPMPLPEVVELIQSKAEIPDEEAYGMFGMGHGTINAMDEPEAGEFIDIASENNVGAKVIGAVTEGPGIVMRSGGAMSRGQKVTLAA